MSYVAPPWSGPTVSVVVVSHNEGDLLRLTVQNLLRTLPPPSEVVVVDDLSTDGSTEFLLKSPPNVRLLSPGVRLGVSRARNFGAQAAQGRMLVFCDAHVALGYNWPGCLAATLSEPVVGAATAVVTNMSELDAKGYGMTVVDDTLKVRWVEPQAAVPYPIPIFCGCFVAFRREVFFAVGGFDPGLLQWGYEDIEMSIRLWLLGYQCRLDPNVVVAHHFRESFPYSVDDDVILHNRLRVGLLHYGPARLARFFETLRADAVFARALARLMQGDAALRRLQLQTVRRYDDDWFFRNLVTGAAGPQPNGANQA